MAKKKKRTKTYRRANGKGTVYKLSGNRRKPWVAAKTIALNDNGNAVRVIIGYYEEQEDAELALLQYKHIPGQEVTKDITVEQAFKIIFKEAEKEGRSKSTLDVLNASYNALQTLKHEKLTDLTWSDCQFLIDTLIEDPKQKSSHSKLNKIRNLLSRMFDLLIKHKIQHDNPAKFISLRGVKEGEVPPFPEADIQKLFKNDSDRIAKSSLILAYTGLRIGEFLELRKFLNVDMKRWLIVGGGKTEAGTDRAIPIHPKIQPYVQYFFNEYPNCELLFSREGEKVTPSYYRKYYHGPLVEQLGLSDLNPHSFRHTAASKFKMAGLDDKAITDMIGHTNIDFTNKRYVSVDDEYLHKQISMVK